MDFYPCSRVDYGDVVLLPVLDCDDVLFLRNEPVFFTQKPFSGLDDPHWFVYLLDGRRIVVEKVREKVFFGYYVDGGC